MFTPEMMESVKKVEATRASRLGTEPRRMTAEEKDQLLVNSIIQLVRQFGVKTVAEGIETQKQVDILKEMHCDYIQGYVYYKPLPQKGYERLLLQSSPQAVKEIMEACAI